MSKFHIEEEFCNELVYALPKSGLQLFASRPDSPNLDGYESDDESDETMPNVPSVTHCAKATVTMDDIADSVSQMRSVSIPIDVHAAKTVFSKMSSFGPGNRAGHSLVTFNPSKITEDDEMLTENASVSFSVLFGGYSSGTPSKAASHLNDLFLLQTCVPLHMSGNESTLFSQHQNMQEMMENQIGNDGLENESNATEQGDSQRTSGIFAKWTILETSGETPSPRCDHTAVVDHGTNRMYIYGGADETERLEDLHILDLNTFAWSSPETTGDHPGKLSIHTSCIHGDGLYVFGGSDGLERRSGIFRLDLGSFEWSRVCPVGSNGPLAVNSHKSTVVNDTWIIFGGSLGPGKCTGALQVFDFASQQWIVEQPQGMSPQARYAHTMSVIGEQYAVVIGGKSSTHRFGDIHVLDTLNKRWFRCHPSNNDSNSSSALSMFSDPHSLLAPIGLTSRIGTIDSHTSSGLASFASSNASVCSTGSTSSSISSRGGGSPVSFFEQTGLRKRAHSVDAENDDRSIVEGEFDDSACLNPISHLGSIEFDMGVVLVGGKHNRSSSSSTSSSNASDGCVETQIVVFPSTLMAAAHTKLIRKESTKTARQGEELVLVLDSSTAFQEDVVEAIDVHIDCVMEMEDNIDLVDSLQQEEAKIRFCESRQEAAFVPLHSGAYSVSVKIGEFHVSGSPFHINVLPKLTEQMKLVERNLVLAPTSQERLRMAAAQDNHSLVDIVSHCRSALQSFGVQEFDDGVLDVLREVEDDKSLGDVRMPMFDDVQQRVDQHLLRNLKVFSAVSPEQWKKLTLEFTKTQQQMEDLESARAEAFDERKKARKTMSASSVQRVREAQLRMFEFDKQSIELGQKRRESLQHVRNSLYRRFESGAEGVTQAFEQHGIACQSGIQSQMSEIELIQRQCDADILQLGENVKDLIVEQTKVGTAHQKEVNAHQQQIEELDERAAELHRELRRVERAKQTLEHELQSKKQKHEAVMMDFGWAQLVARQWRKSCVRLKSLHLQSGQALSKVGQATQQAVKMLGERVMSHEGKLQRMETGVVQELLGGCHQLHQELAKETKRLLAIDSMIKRECTSLEEQAKMQLEFIQQDMFAETQEHLASKQKALQDNSENMEEMLRWMAEVEEIVADLSGNSQTDDSGSWILVGSMGEMSDSLRTTWTEGSFSTGSSSSSLISSTFQDSMSGGRESEIRIKAHCGPWCIKICLDRETEFSSVQGLLMERFQRAGVDMDSDLVDVSISYVDSDGDQSIVFDDETWRIALEEHGTKWIEVDIVPTKKKKQMTG